ncbi:MAG: hypothetical protein IK124_04050 [Prevotella sp.]|nr:hypothetical protein [Prevotella sp.]
MKTNNNKGIKSVALLPFLLLALLIMPAACMEDEGNYDYIDLPEFRVDTVGVNQQYTVQQFNTLQVPSHLVYAGSKSDLAYRWSIYNTGYGQSDNLATILAETEDLNVEITAKPGNYILEFVAQNVNTGERAANQYRLTVESAAGTGLMVLYERNGLSDIDIVRTPILNTSLTNTTVSRNFYSSVNSTIVKGTPKILGYNNNHSYIFTDIDGVRLSNEDLTQIEDYDGIFYTKPDSHKPMHYYGPTTSEILINNGDVHMMIGGWDNGLHYFPGPKAMQGDSYYAEKAMVVYGGGPFCFDSKGHRFLYCGLWSGEFLPTGDARLSNINRDITHMSPGYPLQSTIGKTYAFFKDPTDASKRSLMIIDATVNSNASKLMADIDLSGCPEVSEMQNILTTTNSPMFYYSSTKSAYVCPVGIDEQTAAVPSAPLWTCPSNETITAMQLLNGNKILAIATWTGSEGKLYLFNTDLASGVTDPTPVETFTGFGKIVDMQYKSAQ